MLSFIRLGILILHVTVTNSSFILLRQENFMKRDSHPVGQARSFSGDGSNLPMRVVCIQVLTFKDFFSGHSIDKGRECE